MHDEVFKGKHPDFLYLFWDASIIKWVDGWTEE
jgi:hypothetical protein